MRFRATLEVRERLWRAIRIVEGAAVLGSDCCRDIRSHPTHRRSLQAVQGCGIEIPHAAVSSTDRAVYKAVQGVRYRSTAV